MKTILFAEVDEAVWCLLAWLRCRLKIENIFIDYEITSKRISTISQLIDRLITKIQMLILVNC